MYPMDLMDQIKTDVSIVASPQNLAKSGKTWVGNTGMHNGDLSRQ